LFADAAIRALGDILDFFTWCAAGIFALFLLLFSPIFKDNSLLKFTFFNLVIFSLLQWWRLSVQDDYFDEVVILFVNVQALILFISSVCAAWRFRKSKIEEVKK